MAELPADDEVYTLHRGRTPLLVSMPHVGTWLPDALRERLVDRASLVEDTDWHLERLYAFARDLGASVLVPRANRYLIDLNRPPENSPMYPGVNNTELCPTRFFTGEPLYREGQAPDEAEVQERVKAWWQPYHDAMKAELRRLKATHGHAVLFDAHSIRSELPWLFEGRLRDLNIGTATGGSCHAELSSAVTHLLSSQSRYSSIVDGRFKGGFITRHYGRPSQQVHAIQLEMTWRCYMDETPPYAWNGARAAEVRPLLESLVRTLRDWRPQ